METLVIYDAEGTIITTINGNVHTFVGIPTMSVQIPDGKLLTRIDVTTSEHKPVFEDRPTPPVEILSDKISNIDTCLDDIMLYILPELEAMIQEVRGGE